MTTLKNKQDVSTRYDVEVLSWVEDKRKTSSFIKKKCLLVITFTDTLILYWAVPISDATVSNQ